MNFNHTLHKLGLSPIEASVFIILCKHGSLTGYEVAKLSGISRSNVYAALYSLQEKGKCHISEGEVAKYAAISKEELLLSTQRDMQQTLANIELYYPSNIVVSEPYMSIRGYDNVLDKIKNCILLCESHLYIMGVSRYILLLSKELMDISHLRRVTIICEAPIALGDDITFYHSKKHSEGFHMIIDTKTVITGDLNPDNAQCLHSSNTSLVRLMKESFITAMDLIKLQND